MGRTRGWPITLTEPDLLDAPIVLRPPRVSDARTRHEIRARNASWLRPWDASDPQTPAHRSQLRPHSALIGPIREAVRPMRETAGPLRAAYLGQRLPWVVTYDGQLAGELGVWAIAWGSSRSAQVYYWIDESFAGRGIIPTALAMAVDHCFRVAGLHRIEAVIMPENTASRRVVEKLGFREEGLHVRRVHIDGAWRDHICYAITAEEVPAGMLSRWRSLLSASRSSA